VRERKPGVGTSLNGQGGGEDAPTWPGKRTKVQAALRAGAPLPPALRGKFEQSLGKDLGNVRIHDDAEAGGAAVGRDARAAALGDDIAFAPGEYQPDTPEGQRLIGHEVAHTVQQRGRAADAGQVTTTQPGDPAEKEADAAGSAMNAGQPAEVSSQPAQLARKKPGEHDIVSGRDMFKTATGTVQKAGTVANVHAVKDGDKVVVQTPGISMTGTFALKPNVDPDPETVEVGWTQTVVSSERVGVYKKGGKVWRKNVIALPTSTRDARNGAAAPWYEAPSTITKTQREAYPVAEDQPKLVMDAKLDGAELAETQGADRFSVSLSFGGGGKAEHVQSFEWQAPWGVTLDASGTGTGGDLSMSKAGSFEEPAETKKSAKEVADDEANKIQTYETEDAAIEGLNKGSIQTFIADLPRHKAKSSTSYWNMVGALWKSKAQIHIKLSRVGDDTDIDKVELSADKTYSFGESNTESSHAILAHMVYDPAALKPGHVIQLMINGTSFGHLTFPYNSTKVTGATLNKPGVFGGSQYEFNIEMWLA
jgi:uncharacterized protein DUF4157